MFQIKKCFDVGTKWTRSNLVLVFSLAGWNIEKTSKGKKFNYLYIFKTLKQGHYLLITHFMQYWTVHVIIFFLLYDCKYTRNSNNEQVLIFYCTTILFGTGALWSQIPNTWPRILPSLKIHKWFVMKQWWHGAGCRYDGGTHYYQHNKTITVF